MHQERSVLLKSKSDHGKEIAGGILTIGMAAFIIVVLPPIIAFIAVKFFQK